MSPLLDNLSAELRLQIYEDVLHFDCPIRYVSITDGIPPVQSDRDLPRANISLLLTCKTIYSEATPVLLKQNIISLRHDDVCPVLRGFIGPRFSCQDLIERLQLVDQQHHLGWFECSACSYEPSTFISTFTQKTFPKLRTAQVIVKHGGPELSSKLSYDFGEGISAYRKAHGLALTFTGVGAFDLAIDGSNIRVGVVYPAVAKSWTYIRALPSGHPQLYMNAPVSEFLLKAGATVELVQECKLLADTIARGALFDGSPTIGFGEATPEAFEWISMMLSMLLNNRLRGW